MIVEFIPASAVDASHVAMLMESFKAGPAFEHRSASEVLGLLQNPAFQLYAIGPGIMLVHVQQHEQGRRLVLDAAYTKGVFIRSWVQVMQKMAAEWKCDEIETIAYCPRLARAMMLAGAEQEAVVLKMEVRHGAEE